MRKLILSAAAIVALSLSAFAGTPETKGEAKPEATTSTMIHYGNTGNGVYVRLQNAPNPANCASNDAYPCTISSTEDLSGFEYDERPDDSSESTSKSVYTGS